MSVSLPKGVGLVGESGHRAKSFHASSAKTSCQWSVSWVSLGTSRLCQMPQKFDDETSSPPIEDVEEDFSASKRQKLFADHDFASSVLFIVYSEASLLPRREKNRRARPNRRGEEEPPQTHTKDVFSPSSIC